MSPLRFEILSALEADSDRAGTAASELTDALMAHGFTTRRHALIAAINHLHQMKRVGHVAEIGTNRPRLYVLTDAGAAAILAEYRKGAAFRTFAAVQNAMGATP
jgi:hypothetical protein